MDTQRGFRAGLVFGGVVRGIVLGLLLSVAAVSIAGHVTEAKVFRYEGF